MTPGIRGLKLSTTYGAESLTDHGTTAVTTFPGALERHSFAITPIVVADAAGIVASAAPVGGVVLIPHGLKYDRIQLRPELNSVSSCRSCHYSSGDRGLNSVSMPAS